MEKMSQRLSAMHSARPNKISSWPPVVFVDADNTLWDTDGVFSAAQLSLLADVENALDFKGVADNRLEYVRSVDQAIAANHHLGLRYPAGLLITAMAHRIKGESATVAARKAWNDASGTVPELLKQQIETNYMSQLHQLPMLLPGVAVGLARLRHEGANIFVVTEGGRHRVSRTLDETGLAGYVDRVIDAIKRKSLYQRVRQLVRPTSRTFMIGDQLTRDILPANEAGIETIYIESRFRPVWEHDTAITPSFYARSFSEATDLVLTSLEQ